MKFKTAKNLLASLALISIIALLFTGCGDKTPNSPTANNTTSSNDVSTSEIQNTSVEQTALTKDEQVKKVFEKVSQKLLRYSCLDTPSALLEDINCNIFNNETKTINGKIFCKTDVSFQKVNDEYSKLFSGDLLDKFINQYFYNDNNVLYVYLGGGKTGINIKELKVEYIDTVDSKLNYKALITQESNGNTLNTVEAKFSIVKMGDEYKVTSSEYFPEDQNK